MTVANIMILLRPADGKSFIMNMNAGERIKVREEKVHVFGVQYTEDEARTIMLDSGAGVSAWPRSVCRGSG